ncbi:hypothetical protein [Sphingomonas sp. CFBP 8760]|uniref:hypothetical protein n=1 Tax=Sphingomonas sp. CFBP 8760 TaxID=2775282 RepID=UPI0017802836|nr:hypothetical protein [Sphingomonas sp. CFBP 8760]MBD8546038.1 hypothetical protein [Sphingomonas sp. CFBP 8760]
MTPRVIDPELPWGNWLRGEHVNGTTVFVDDETGERWPSLRVAFWTGRLRMPNVDGRPPTELLETMHAVLVATIRRKPTLHEQQGDLFERSKLYLRLFHLWLAREGLVELEENGHGAKALTAEGMAVIHMLLATRPYDVRQQRPSAATIAQLCELGLGPEGREDRLARVEKAAARWDVAFLRRHEAGRPSIILSKRGDGVVPIFETVWTLGLGSEEQRDRFYEWMCIRMDRWPDWGEMATSYGSERLTHHLLEAVVATLADGEVGNQIPGIACDT